MNTTAMVKEAKKMASELGIMRNIIREGLVEDFMEGICLSVLVVSHACHKHRGHSLGGQGHCVQHRGPQHQGEDSHARNEDRLKWGSWCAVCRELLVRL